MSTVAATRAPSQSCRIDLDHSEHFFRGVSALTIDPLKNLVTYFVPWIDAAFRGYVEMRADDPAQVAMMPPIPTRIIKREIADLTRCAGIEYEVLHYSALNHHFSGCGGSLSFTKPAVYLPYQHLFRHGKQAFGQEPNESLFKGDIWSYSDNETRFLIARELGQLKGNNALLRIAIKVIVLIAFFAIYTGPLGLVVGGLLLLTGIALYLVSERYFQGKADIQGAEILAKRLNEGSAADRLPHQRRKATRAAIRALKKMQDQNIERRASSSLCKYYITKTGNNLLDLDHPFLSTRIANLEKHLQTIA